MLTCFQNKTFKYSKSYYFKVQNLFCKYSPEHSYDKIEKCGFGMVNGQAALVRAW